MDKIINKDNLLQKDAESGGKNDENVGDQLCSPQIYFGILM